jgi:hypothetical protein
VERNLKADQNPQRVVAPTEEEEEDDDVEEGDGYQYWRAY